MEEFETYIESLVGGLGLNRKNRTDLEDEILNHLVLLKGQYLEEGFMEQEAAEMAMHAFGDRNRLKNGFKKVLFPYKYFQTILLIFAAVYLVTIFWNLFLANSFYQFQAVERFANLVPFATITHYYNTLQFVNSPAMLRHLYGNVLLFIPFGFFVPALFEKMKTAPRVLLCALIFAAFLELAQYATFSGTADIDDVILRTAGAAAGYLVYLNLAKATAWIQTPAVGA